DIIIPDGPLSIKFFKLAFKEKELPPIAHNQIARLQLAPRQVGNLEHERTLSLYPFLQVAAEVAFDHRSNSCSASYSSCVIWSLPIEKSISSPASISCRLRWI